MPSASSSGGPEGAHLRGSPWVKSPSKPCGLDRLGQRRQPCVRRSTAAAARPARDGRGPRCRTRRTRPAPPCSCWRGTQDRAGHVEGVDAQCEDVGHALSGAAAMRQSVNWASSRSPATATAASASWNCTAWNAESGLPNWIRVLTCSTASSTARSTVPRICIAVSASQIHVERCRRVRDSPSDRCGGEVGDERAEPGAEAAPTGRARADRRRRGWRRATGRTGRRGRRGSAPVGRRRRTGAPSPSRSSAPATGYGSATRPGRLAQRGGGREGLASARGSSSSTPSACRTGATLSPRKARSSSASRAASTPPRSAKALRRGGAELDGLVGQDGFTSAAPQQRLRHDHALHLDRPRRHRRGLRGTASGPRSRRGTARSVRLRGARRRAAWKSSSATCWSHWVTAMRGRGSASTSGGLARLLRPDGPVGEQPGDAHLDQRAGPRGVHRRGQLVPHAAPARAERGQQPFAPRVAGDADPLVGEGAADDGPALADAAEHRVGPGGTRRRRTPRSGGAARASTDRPHGDARRVHRDEEHRDALVTLALPTRAASTHHCAIPA